MQITWTTTNGKKVEMECNKVAKTCMVSLSIKIDGIQYQNAKKDGKFISFTARGQAAKVTLPEDAAAQIEAIRNFDDRTTEEKLAFAREMKAEQKYQADYRRTTRAMNA